MDSPVLDPNVLFGERAVDSMNDIAALILVSRSIHDIRARFRNDTEIDYGAARPRANRIGNFARETAQLLLTCIQRGTTEADLSARIDQVRTDRAGSIAGVIGDAKFLAEQETAANLLHGVTGSGVVNSRIMSTLQALESKWVSSAVTSNA